MERAQNRKEGLTQLVAGIVLFLIGLGLTVVIKKVIFTGLLAVGFVYALFGVIRVIFGIRIGRG